MTDGGGVRQIVQIYVIALECLHEGLADAEALAAIDDASERLLARARAPITATATMHVPVDVDVFVMDNSDTAKEGVSRTCAGVDGYTPIEAQLGEEGWCVDLELRNGSAHSANEGDYALQRALEGAARLTAAPVVVRMDAGFDAGKLSAIIHFGAHCPALVCYQRLHPQWARGAP